MKKQFVLVQYHGKSGSDRTKILEITEEQQRNINMRKEGLFYMSPAYGTKAELIKDNEILEEPCKKCGDMVKTSFVQPTKEKLIKHGICFTCNHWREVAKTKDEPNRFFVNGTAYTALPDSDEGFVGFGGREFKFKRFGSNEIIVSHNVWSQGDIAPEWRKDIPDNAEIVK